MRSWQDKIIHDPAAWRKDLDHLVGCTLMLTNGCFDLIHYGHIELLQTARINQGNGNGIVLIVAVNSDNSVRQLKGPTRPLNPQHQRLAVVAALESVDRCLIFDEKRCDNLIHTLRPHIWVKGGDYTLETLDPGERAAASAVNAKIKIIPFTNGISTTNTIFRIISQSQAAPAC
jgi:rfaE bifunctional protein nucleotidyltransferase chain/domain